MRYPLPQEPSCVYMLDKINRTIETTLLKVRLHHGCLSSFSKCINVTKPHKASQMKIIFLSISIPLGAYS